MGADMGPFWKQGLCACGMMSNNLKDRNIRVEKECSSASYSLTMGFSTANPVYAWGLQRRYRVWQAKKCFVIDARWDL